MISSISPRALLADLLLVALSLVALGSCAHAAVPSYDAARAWGAQLQQDYVQRGPGAIVDRVDGAMMRARLRVPMTADPSNAKQEQAEWEKIFAPIITRDIVALEPFKSMFFERVALIDGERVILLILLDDKAGTFHAMKVWLEARADGKIVIADLAMLGDPLETTRRMRHTMLLLGAPFSSARDDEERGLSFFSDECRYRVQGALQAMQRDELDDAFNIWDHLPNELKSSRLWRTTRDILAYRGCAAARKNWFADYQLGRSTSPLLDLATARTQKDAAKVLATFDRLIAWSFDSPHIRVEKAGYLVELGRHDEALALAQSVYEFNPYAAEAYTAALRVAVSLHRTPDAIAALQQWRMISSTTAIDEFLATQPFATELRSSAAYTAWKSSPPPPAGAAPVTEPSNP